MLSPTPRRASAIERPTLRAAIVRVLLSGVIVVAGLATSMPRSAIVRAQDVPAGEACHLQWRSLPLPRSARRSRPYEVVVGPDGPAWVVGEEDGTPLVLRRRSGRWIRVDAPPAGLPSTEPAAFHDARQAPDGSLVAVGNTRPFSRVMQPLSGWFGRTRWRQRRIGDVPSTNVSLAGIAQKGRSGAWAVGSWLDGGRTRAYALRWSGSRWVQRDPEVGRGESGLTAAATAGGSVWAVGWADDRSGVKRPLILRASASGWQGVPAPALPEGIGVLTDVEFAGRRSGWAVGYLVPAGSSLHVPILMHWDGGTWSDVPMSWSGDDSTLPRSISVAANGGIWMAGTQLPAHSGTPRGFVAHAPDGPDGAWAVLDELSGSADRSEAFAVAAMAEGAIVSGVVGPEAFVAEATCAEATAADRSAASTRGRDVLATANWSDDAGAPADPSPVDGPTFLQAPSRGGLGRAVRPEGFRIRDVAREVGLRVTSLTLEGISHDLDGDGWEDVFFWNHADPVHFFLGGPEGFRRGPEDAFGRLDRHGCSVADVDGDGVDDVFCSAGRLRGSAIDRHELSLRPGHEDGGVVADVGGIEDPLGRGRAATFIQLDDDGLPDLFVANSPDRGDALPGTNRFFRNVGGRFVAAPEVGLDTSVGGWCAAAADVDGDGDEDLLLCQEHADDRRPPGLRVFVNDAGRLRERSRRLGIEPLEDIEVVVTDMTGDGRADIVQLSRTRLRISRATRGGGFEPIFELVMSDAEGVAAGDVDGDGATDLYVVRGSQRTNDADLLLVNRGRGRSFTSVRLPQARRGSGADVMAIDHDQNGLTDFVVLNGRGSDRGPVQLLASFPVSRPGERSAILTAERGAGTAGQAPPGEVRPGNGHPVPGQRDRSTGWR